MAMWNASRGWIVGPKMKFEDLTPARAQSASCAHLASEQFEEPGSRAMIDAPQSRRAMFRRLGGGLGTVALASLVGSTETVRAAGSEAKSAGTHHSPRAKR